ncbi:hypothetical protein SAMN05444166_3432 [Singulisphaera sp. GP187]|uniref:hypothetical protein n=1 Tax=Singulisphaera sp. GP187 TaxID=1882752 RepID=UPI00092750B8|nr:hypothetical protein [Singulisphaera sp. GP187]SIO27890.1 hypothetical protein SAMN05444166_3432 [Singulisphaera sp. GP187]
MIAQRYFGEGEIGSIPRSRATGTATAISVQGFMACPPALMMGRFGEADVFSMGVQELYRLAYEQAKACVAPPWHLQSLLSGTN